jgi:hypothetical protein
MAVAGEPSHALFANDGKAMSALRINPAIFPTIYEISNIFEIQKKKDPEMKNTSWLVKIGVAAALSFPLLALETQDVQARGECGPGYTPGYVRMTESVYRNNWKAGTFDELSGWNSVVSRYGVSVAYAQGQTCGCTNYSNTNPPLHRSGNATCNRALKAGLR